MTSAFTTTFARNRKEFIVSTPTIKGFSRIETAFERSDQQYFHVPCPECGAMQPIMWRNIKWKDRDPATVALVCEHCDIEIPEHKKTWLLDNGRWVTTGDGDCKTAGFHLSALYSPLGWYSWEQAVRDFLQAKKAGAEALKTWSNTVLGETWEESGETVDESSLLAGREQYAAEVPAGALVLTAGVDVQDDRLEVAIYGYGPGEESWAIDYRVLWGDPGQSKIWKQLDDILMTDTYKSEHGHRMSICATCIDSGGHHTQAVYDYVKPRQYHRIFAIKGMAGFGRPIVAAPSRKRTGRNRRQVSLFTVGVDPAKGLIYSRLKLTEKGPGYCHFPATEDFDEEFFAQLTAEKCVTRYIKGFPKREWIKTRSRNEALDCTVYALAALYNLNPKWDALVANVEKQIGGDEPKENEPKRASSVRRRRRGGWLNSWDE